MWLSIQLLRMIWIASILTLLCSGTPLSSAGKSSVASLTGTSIHSPTFIEPADSYEDKGTEEEETEDGVLDDAEEGSQEVEEEEEITSTDEPLKDHFTDFDDSDDLDALAKGILGSNDNKESVAPCFGTWWPSNGGYVYYYEDYNTGGDTTGGDYDTGDYGRRRNRRNRNRNRKRRMRRNRSKRARTSKKAAKKTT